MHIALGNKNEEKKNEEYKIKNKAFQWNTKEIIQFDHYVFSIISMIYSPYTVWNWKKGIRLP